MHISERIAKRREALGLSQIDLAKIVSKVSSEKWSQSRISHYEQPTSSPIHRSVQVDDLPHLARALGVSVIWLITGKDEPDASIEYEEVVIAREILRLSPEKRKAWSVLLEIDLSDRTELIKRSKVSDPAPNSKQQRSSGSNAKGEEK